MVHAFGWPPRCGGAEDLGFATAFEEDLGACGDGRVNGLLEECDTCDLSLHPEAACTPGQTDFGGASCATFGEQGVLGCTSTCRFDRSQCF